MKEKLKQCKGKRRDGKQCTKYALVGNYCIVHHNINCATKPRQKKEELLCIGKI